jgi:hypothetical protein
MYFNASHGFLLKSKLAFFSFYPFNLTIKLPISVTSIFRFHSTGPCSAS